jgi:hypothetical protein
VDLEGGSQGYPEGRRFNNGLPGADDRNDEMLTLRKVWGAHACSVLVAVFCGDELPV